LAKLRTNRDSRFKSLINGEYAFPVRDIAGYIHVKNKEELVLFTQEGIIEACNGHSYQAVLKEFKKRDLLRHEKDKLTDKFEIPGMSTRMRLYAIKKSFVDYDLLYRPFYIGEKGAIGAEPLKSKG